MKARGFLACFLLGSLLRSGWGAPWIAADWRGREPQFPPGSLFWRTNEFRRCPVLFRTVLEVEGGPIAYAGFRARAFRYAFVFLNGRQVASARTAGGEGPTEPFEVELTPFLRSGANVLILSTEDEGFALEGSVVHWDGRRFRFASDRRRWKVQKFPPLTILEDEPCMRADFDDSQWFPVRVVAEQDLEVKEDEVRTFCQRLEEERWRRWDEDARWRLQMLAEKGFAIVDWEAFGWAGAERLPRWVVEMAQTALEAPNKPAGWLHRLAEGLTRFVRLSDQATNLANHAVGLEALNAPQRDVEACHRAAQALFPLLKRMEAALKGGDMERAMALAGQGEGIVRQARSGRFLNDLCSALDNKFGWLDTTALLDSDPRRWGLRLASPAQLLTSPLSPAALITLQGRELVLEGWDELPPLRVYQKPPAPGPVCAWLPLDGKVVNRRPEAGGLVYDRGRDGDLSENWALLVCNLAQGGPLPTQVVFLHRPLRILFQGSEKGTRAVVVEFEQAGARLFLLRPLKEWRGLLWMARLMTQGPLDEEQAQGILRQCRLWSRALLNYPITFSETFVRAPGERWALLVADVYNYLELRDEWGTQPLRLAPLPPLVTYGLMGDYPGLQVVSKVETLGSWGIWGDHLAAVGQSHVVYRVPLDPFPRFGGFTAFCFGPTDIGEPGSLTEIQAIRRTGANSFRPQHNQTGERALRTLRWCLEGGLQHVFNTDEKWVPDIVEHFRTLAEQCKDLPFDAVAYDLLNEPETRDPHAYNALIRKIVRAIREVDKTHLIYVETIPPWGLGAQPFPQAAFENLRPTGDPLTVYSFHDYEFRLPPRWPNERQDIRSILVRWIPAFRFSIDHRAPIHLGEFGAFEQTKEDIYENRCALTLMLDYFRIFDQFGWHFHYYSNRGTVRVREDGSLQESLVQEAFRRYFARGTFNLNRR